VSGRDAAGREKRSAALRQARALLDESTAEAKQLSEERELRRLIDDELARPGRSRNERLTSNSYGAFSTRYSPGAIDSAACRMSSKCFSSVGR
jgi:hypothetical protein